LMWELIKTFAHLSSESLYYCRLYVI
jgi:hypothetical protein